MTVLPYLFVGGLVVFLLLPALPLAVGAGIVVVVLAGVHAARKDV